MTEKKFNAILAKNEIAREIRNYQNGEPISVNQIRFSLKELENYLGEANQPSAKDILESDMRL